MKFASLLGFVLTLAVASAYGQRDYRLSGHVKYRFTVASSPHESLFRRLSGDTTANHGADIRLNLDWRSGGWGARADYQLVGLKGETFAVTHEAPEERLFLTNLIPTDRRRLFDLNSVITEGNDYAILHRVDRLWAGYTGENTTIRLGRQAISWGNGMIYTPMDFLNPFDPAAVDKEYKPGDDMAYGQYALPEGNDLQGALVLRRDLMTENVGAKQSTLVFKYHGFRGSSEVDVLIAEHYADMVVAAGGNWELGGAVWRGDVVVTSTSGDTVPQLVTSLSRSWNAWGKNMSGVVEYYFNGFGQSDGDYSPGALASNPDLVQRITRGELFTLARQYIAASVTVEIAPLLLAAPNLFVNLSDASALFQAVIQYDFRQDMFLLGSLSVPIGPDGTEFGGIPSAVPDEFLSNGPALFFQLAAYF